MSRGQTEGEVFCPSLGQCCVGHAQYSAIAPGTLEAAIGFSVLFVAFRSKFAPTVHENSCF